MGDVYLAQDMVLDRKVALKFFPEELEQNEIARKRFLREAKLAAAIDHLYICNTFDIGEEDDRAFLALENVEGPTLADQLVEGPLPVKETLRTVTDLRAPLLKRSSRVLPPGLPRRMNKDIRFGDEADESAQLFARETG